MTGQELHSEVMATFASLQSDHKLGLHSPPAAWERLFVLIRLSIDAAERHCRRCREIRRPGDDPD